MRSSCRIEIANAISKLWPNDDDAHDKLSDVLSNSEEEKGVDYTDDEALALMEDAKFSESQYEIIHMQAKATNANI